MNIRSICQSRLAVHTDSHSQSDLADLARFVKTEPRIGGIREHAFPSSARTSIECFSLAGSAPKAFQEPQPSIAGGPI
jgi:hypothetical protein